MSRFLAVHLQRFPFDPSVWLQQILHPAQKGGGSQAEQSVKRLQVNVEVALTSLWSPMWSHLCPWWDTLSPGLNFLCTDAYSQTLGQNSLSPGSLHLNRTLPFSSMKLHQRCKWRAGSLLTGSEHILYPRLVQLKITLRGNVKDLNNICWNDTRASPYWRIILSFEE